MSAAAKVAAAKVVVFALGGTIASASDSGGGALVRLSGADLVAAVPQVAQVAAVEAHSVTMVPSGDLTISDLIRLGSMIEQAVADGATGVVVSQGTDTLEETSYALDLICRVSAPVVCTGAMRTASQAGADGPANLLAAIRVAAAPAARGLGVLVAFGDEIHAARFVRKRHATSPGTFGSPLAGPVGYLIEDRVVILLRPPGSLHVAVPENAPDARVTIVLTHLGDDGGLVAAVPSLGYDGMVLAALGAGHVPSRIVPALESAVSEMPVVLASRTGAGDVLTATYGFPGSESDLVRRGLIPASGLDPAHAAVLLRLLLMAGIERDRLDGYFKQACRADGEIVAAARRRRR